VLVFMGVENHRSQFEDTDTRQTHWVDLTPDDGQVQVQGDQATMRSGGRIAVVPIKGGPVRWM